MGAINNSSMAYLHLELIWISSMGNCPKANCCSNLFLIAQFFWIIAQIRDSQIINGLKLAVLTKLSKLDSQKIQKKVVNSILLVCNYLEVLLEKLII